VLSETIYWAQLDARALVRFERHLREYDGNCTNSVRGEIRRLRRVIRQAVRDGVIRVDGDPFLRYKMPKEEPVERRRLTIAEIEALASLELPTSSFEAESRDAYLLAFYGGGARFSDTACLRLENIQDGRLMYRMLKNKKSVSIKLPPPALILIERRRPLAEPRPRKYLFSFLRPSDERDGVQLRRRISSANVRVNQALKALAEMAGIEKEGLSFHTARHSFADYARRRGGDIYGISKALRHSRLKETEAYLASFDERAVDDLTDQLWGT
jgi:integrase